jgi:hypothetical protein
MGGSVQAMMRAAGYSNEKDFFKAVELGKVLTKDVLPKFSQELKNMSRAGGALDKTMESTPAQFTRFMNALTDAKLVFYDNGMNEGLAYMFKEFADTLKDLNPLMMALGKVFKGALMTITFAFKALAIPFKFVIKLFENLGEVFESLGLKDAGGMLWTLVGGAGGGLLLLMASKFGVVAKAVNLVNAALLTTLARLAPFIAAYAAIEDVFLWAKHGDKYDTVTGTAINAISENSIGRRYLSNTNSFKDDGLLTKGLGGQMAMLEMWKAVFTGDRSALTVHVNDSEFAKAITVTSERNNQAKTAATQSEVSQ